MLIFLEQHAVLFKKYFCSVFLSAVCCYIAASYVIIILSDFTHLQFNWPLCILLWPSVDPSPYCCYLWYHHLLSQGDQPVHTDQNTQLELTRSKTEFRDSWIFVDLSLSSFLCLSVWLVLLISSKHSDLQLDSMKSLMLKLWRTCWSLFQLPVQTYS